MTLRKCVALVVVLALCFCMTACNKTLISPDAKPTTTTATTKGTDPTTGTTTTTTGATTTTTTATGSVTDDPSTDNPPKDPIILENNVGTAYPDKEIGFQLEKPLVGETIAIIHTSKGDISLRLFPEAAPKAVENFITHAKNGYYDGLTFHRVIEDFMVQGGDPKGDGSGGESIWGKDFEDEFDQKLINVTGAVSMANNGVHTNGSQFFINQCDPAGFGKRETYSPEYREKAAKELWDNLVKTYGEEMVKQYYESWEDIITDQYVYEWIPDEAWDVYEKHGGNLHLDGAYRREGGHTVFGQVFDGMDVVEAIAGVVVDSNNKPSIPVYINSIEITTYQG